MSTIIWPPLSNPALIKEQEESNIARELTWLLTSLLTSLHDLKAGLEECASLLSPNEPGSTLVLSSQRSENLKGYITRLGTRVIKGDVALRLPSLPVPRGSNAFRITVSNLPAASTLYLEQLSTTRTLINASLDVLDATRWTGDSSNPDFVAGQLQLLHENIQEAKAALKGWTKNQKPWNEDSAPADAFHPPLPDNLSFHLSISEAAILLNVRTLETVYPRSGTSTPISLTSAASTANATTGEKSTSHPHFGGYSYTGFSIRDRLTAVLSGGGGGSASSTSSGSTGGSNTGAGGRGGNFHDEAHDTFLFRGQEVRVKDKVRVESQDPSLLAAFAKLGALERSVALWRRGLGVVMGREVEGADEDEGI